MSEARHTPPAGKGTPRPGLQPLDGDVSYRAILIFTVGLTAVIVIAAGLMWLITTGLRDRVAAQDPPPPVLLEARLRYEPPAPRLQSSPEEELRAMQAEDEAALSGYAWLDEEAGIARVPVARAIELLVASGTARLGDNAAADSALQAAADSGAAAATKVES